MKIKSLRVPKKVFCCALIKQLFSLFSLNFFQIFQLLEFPVEQDKLTTLRELVIDQRENFINLVFNLTSQLNDEELEALETYINHGPDFDSLGK